MVVSEPVDGNDLQTDIDTKQNQSGFRLLQFNPNQTNANTTGEKLKQVENMRVPLGHVTCSF